MMPVLIGLGVVCAVAAVIPWKKPPGKPLGRTSLPNRISDLLSQPEVGTISAFVEGFQSRGNTRLSNERLELARSLSLLQDY